MRHARVNRCVVASVLSLSAAVWQASGSDFLEAFTRPGDPASLVVKDGEWSLLSGTANPTVMMGEFAINNNRNIVKITATEDAGSQFSSGHLFIEHDYLASDPTTFGAGDVLIRTTGPVEGFGVPRIDVSGASFSVDYANGDAISNGPTFYFVVHLLGPSAGYYLVNTPFAGQTTAQVSTATAGPIDTSTVFVPLETGLASDPPDERMIPHFESPTTLSADDLGRVNLIGIYSIAAYDAGPARFDNFRLSNFTASCDADVDGSGVIDLIDLTRMLSSFGVSPGHPNYDPATDLNGDGITDISDLATLLGQFGRTCD